MRAAEAVVREGRLGAIGALERLLELLGEQQGHLELLPT
jgi:hypothetical protein